MDIIPEAGSSYWVSYNERKTIVLVTYVCFERSLFEGVYISENEIKEGEFLFHQILEIENDCRRIKRLQQYYGGL